MKKIILTGLLAAFAIGCQSDDYDALSPNDGPNSVVFTEIGDNELMGSENFSASNLVIHNDAEWDALKAQMDLYNPYSEGFAEQEIDFSVYKIIAVIDQLRNTGGFDITIASITETASQIVVDVQHSDPGGGPANDVHTQPFHIVKIPNSELPIVFE